MKLLGLVMLFLFLRVITDLNSIYGVDLTLMFSTGPARYPPPNFQTVAYQSGIYALVLDMKPASILQREKWSGTLQSKSENLHAFLVWPWDRRILDPVRLIHSSHSGLAGANRCAVRAEEIRDRLGCRVQVVRDSSGHMQTCREFTLRPQQLTGHTLDLRLSNSASKYISASCTNGSHYCWHTSYEGISSHAQPAPKPPYSAQDQLFNLPSSYVKQLEIKETNSFSLTGTRSKTGWPQGMTTPLQEVKTAMYIYVLHKRLV